MMLDLNEDEEEFDPENPDGLFNLYGCGEGRDIYTLRVFKECCDDRSFIDYDGYGYWLDSNLNRIDGVDEVYPSDVLDNKIPENATHVEWLNR